MNWKAIGETFIAVLAAVLVGSLLDKLVISKIGNHLENLIEGNKD